MLCRVVSCGGVSGVLAVVGCGVCKAWMGGANQGRFQEPRVHKII